MRLEKRLIHSIEEKNKNLFVRGGDNNLPAIVEKCVKDKGIYEIVKPEIINYLKITGKIKYVGAIGFTISAALMASFLANGPLTLNRGSVLFRVGDTIIGTSVTAILKVIILIITYRFRRFNVIKLLIALLVLQESIFSYSGYSCSDYFKKIDSIPIEKKLPVTPLEISSGDSERVIMIKGENNRVCIKRRELKENFYLEPNKFIGSFEDYLDCQVFQEGESSSNVGLPILLSEKDIKNNLPSKKTVEAPKVAKLESLMQDSFLDPNNSNNLVTDTREILRPKIDAPKVNSDSKKTIPLEQRTKTFSEMVKEFENEKPNRDLERDFSHKTTRTTRKEKSSEKAIAISNKKEVN